METHQQPPFDFRNLAAYREQQGLSQGRFWSRFGITQSGGSRYENARGIPTPLAMLLLLHAFGHISDELLHWATSELKNNTSYSPD